MKKKSFLFLTSIFIGLTSAVEASARSVSEAYDIARKALDNGRVTLHNTAVNNGDTLYYTFTGDTSGFAIVSAKDQTHALLAYNKDKTLNGNLPEDLTNLLNSYFGNPLNTKDYKTNETAQTSLRVSRLTNCAIEPLLGETAWGQDAPYNLDCPVLNNANCPTGCVATAIAQVMHYYQYPSAVLAEIPAYTTSTNSLARGKVNKGTAINWSKMCDVYGDEYNTESGEAVAQLMSMVGNSLEMDYNTSESSCNKAGIYELATYFGYDAELAHKAFRASFTLTEWYNLLYEELKAGRPILFSGSTMQSGHRFVCDGLDADGLFHINWGWRGDYNGYYDLTLLNPDAAYEIGASDSKDGYTKDQFIILGLQPDNGKTDAQPTTNLVTLSVQHQESNSNHYLFYSFTNPYAKTVTAYIGSGYVDENGKVVKVGGGELSEFETDIKFSDQTASAIDVSTFKEGKYYQVGLIESTDGVNWTVCEGYNNVNVVFTVKNGEVVVASQVDLEADFQTTDFSAVGYTAYGRIDLQNNGSQEYNDAIYLMTSSTTTNPMKYSHAAIVTVEANGTNSLDVSFVPQSDTVYYWVMDKDLNTIKSGFVVRKDAAYKLETTATFDTLASGKIYCQVEVKNTGDTYYNADLVLTLYHLGGNTVVTTKTFIKAGDSTAVAYEVPTTFNYTQYSISDYKGNVILFGQLDNNSSEDKPEIQYNLSFSIFYEKGDSVNGTFTLNNNTAEAISNEYFILVGPSLTSLTTIAFWKTVDVSSNGYSINTFTAVAPGDTLFYRILKGSTPIAQGYALATPKVSVEQHPAIISLQYWAEDKAIVVKSAETNHLTIYDIFGRCLVNKMMHPDEQFRLPAEQGVYIVNGKKLLVK